MKKIFLFPLMFFMITNCFMVPDRSSNNTHSDDTPVDPTPTPPPPPPPPPPPLPHPNPYTPIPHPSIDNQMKEICQKYPQNYICNNYINEKDRVKRPLINEGNISFGITTDKYMLNQNETIINFTDIWEQGWTIPAFQLKKIEDWTFEITSKFYGPDITSNAVIYFIDDKGREIAHSKSNLYENRTDYFKFVKNGAISSTMYIGDNVDFDNINIIFIMFHYLYGYDDNHKEFYYSYGPPIYITH